MPQTKSRLRPRRPGLVDAVADAELSGALRFLGTSGFALGFRVYTSWDLGFRNPNPEHLG